MTGAGATSDGWARFGAVEARGVVEHVDVVAQPQRLRTPGWWAVVGEFEGAVHAWRFEDVRPARTTGAGWNGVRDWRSSLDRAGYVDRVGAVRAAIRDGDVYQVNLCRVLSTPLTAVPDAAALHERLARGNPAPFAGAVHVPAASGFPPVWVVSASPELFLSLDGDVLTSSPIKGTAATPAGLTAKDRAENVMITDLVRNDLQRVCLPGTVEVTALLALQLHPGLAHLVSTVRGVLADPAADDLWGRVLAATFPPGSVSGAPKGAALGLIRALEPVPRGPYCGAVGWLTVADDGRCRARLAVGIRTFWWAQEELMFGTGAGITWGSDPAAEWAETELKAARLVALASR